MRRDGEDVGHGPGKRVIDIHVLRQTQPVGLIVPRPAHNAKYWARVTKGLDFSDADRVDSALFNRILWKGMMGNKPYPIAPDLLNKATPEAKKDID